MGKQTILGYERETFCPSQRLGRALLLQIPVEGESTSLLLWVQQGAKAGAPRGSFPCRLGAPAWGNVQSSSTKAMGCAEGRIPCKAHRPGHSSAALSPEVTTSSCAAREVWVNRGTQEQQDRNLARKSWLVWCPWLGFILVSKTLCFTQRILYFPLLCYLSSKGSQSTLLTLFIRPQNNPGGN